MRGHIQQRGKQSWRVKAYVGRDASGVRRYVERTVRGSRREAEQKLSRLLVEVDEGRHAAAAPVSFGELLDRWLEETRRTGALPAATESQCPSADLPDPFGPTTAVIRPGTA